MSYINVPEIFGSLVFNEKTMKERLSPETYRLFKDSIENEESLSTEVAQEIANAMKDWAIEKGATHFTHWFQPMTGITAEKHDSFIKPVEDSQVIMDFSAKEFIKSEPDASAFPSGGLRATFEARGYATWDPTSFAFIKDKTLYIPSIFSSYSGQILDKKTPLLRSEALVQKQILRILKLFNYDVKRVHTTVGAEQEFFLIDRDMYKKRRDMILTGRTLFGSDPLKSQEMEGHYFGSMNARVKAFMQDLDIELWKLGVYAKTEHNEAAPSQHELAPVYCHTNMATDHNQLTMEMMKKIARKHNLSCVLHEKPFNGVNGSGKHINWSIETDEGKNLLSPGKTKDDCLRFLTFVAAMVQAIDEHQDLIRVSSATAGNDLRLGALEAPPAIISLFLGPKWSSLIESIVNGEDFVEDDDKVVDSGVGFVPTFKKDDADRNRTAPIAFTGNKFEFRIIGSNTSISCPNTIINTIVADKLSQIADKLEGSSDFENDLMEVLREIFKRHSKVIFNGNSYSDDWLSEAATRGLLNLPTTPDALPCYIKQENIDLFEKHGIYSEEELVGRYEVLMENYIGIIRLEADTMIDMIDKQIIPAIVKYMKMLAETINAKTNVSHRFQNRLETRLLDNLSKMSDVLLDKRNELDRIKKFKDFETIEEKANYCRDNIIPAMNELRSISDKLECTVNEEFWPYPSYSDLLYTVI
ncbi:MAG: glutamine synthetase III [Clostridia bacterium]|nr:glutamine synthetase III [Clostridia bacterium]